MPTDQVQLAHGGAWHTVCRYGDLLPGRGVAVLLHGEQVAVFRGRTGELYAVQNYDPFSGAYVLSRGITGSRGDVPVVFSPMYKQAFDLRSGTCLDEEAAPGGGPARLLVWPVRIAPSAPR